MYSFLVNIVILFIPWKFDFGQESALVQAASRSHFEGGGRSLIPGAADVNTAPQCVIRSVSIWAEDKKASQNTLYRGEDC